MKKNAKRLINLARTTFYSWKLNGISKGCKLCVKGRKLVLVITGLCADKCYYCPLSDQKKGKDIVWANEWKNAGIKDVLEEARLTEAKGAGITGGDPLLKLDRTIKLIKILKKTFGKKFHIHLYTPFTLVTKERLERLHKAGLDEIRFHPFIEKPADWKKIDVVIQPKYDWDVGIEIPVIPRKYKEMLEMILYFEPKIKFLNLNELEISDANANKLIERGFRTKSRLSYGVEGSEKTALMILKALAKKGSKLMVHYCTAQLKDRAQLASRIKIRAKNIAKDYDTITNEGTLIRGALYLNSLSPVLINYRKALESARSDDASRLARLQQLCALQKILIKNLEINKKIKKKITKKINKSINENINTRINTKIKKKLLVLDTTKLRLLTSPDIAKELSKSVHELGVTAAIVEEYPTWDAMEVDVWIL